MYPESFDSMTRLATTSGMHLERTIRASRQPRDAEPVRDRPERQRRHARGRDDEGRRDPDGLPARRLALQQEPVAPEDRHRQAEAEASMDFIESIAIAASGLKAQAGRMRVIAENIANADSTARRPVREPYRRKIPTFQRQFDRELDAQTRRARPRPPRPERLPAPARARPPGGRRQRLRPACPTSTR